jgi:hypothetical protein
VEERPAVAVTLITLGNFGPRVTKELVAYFHVEDPDRLKARIRYGRKSNLKRCWLIAVRRLLEIPEDRKTSVLMEYFTTYYDKLTRSEPIQCTNSGETYNGILKPDGIVADVSSLHDVYAVCSLSINPRSHSDCQS